MSIWTTIYTFESLSYATLRRDSSARRVVSAKPFESMVTRISAFDIFEGMAASCKAARDGISRACGKLEEEDIRNKRVLHLLL